MEHPVFQSYKSRIVYTVAWAILAFVQAFVVWGLSDRSFGVLLVDCIIYNFMLACCTLAIWYPVRFGIFKYVQRYTSVALYSVMGFVVVMACLTIHFLFMILITWGSLSYLKFMLVSLPWKMVFGWLLMGISILVYYLLIYTHRLREQTDNEVRLQQMIRDVELNMLKSQINPHFLFNSLNSVNALILSSPEQAQEMLVALSDYLRYTVLATKREVSSLQEEMENIERYLAIEKLRFRERLRYHFEVSPDCLQTLIPSMLLQPLFENAIKHGVYERIQEVEIGAKVRKESGVLHIEIVNDFDSEQAGPRKGSGTGLKNIKERLHLSYGHLSSLQTKIENEKFIVLLQIPL
jgi:sensor histidine kinase YesM